jgi:hypothetical protein
MKEEGWTESQTETFIQAAVQADCSEAWG